MEAIHGCSRRECHAAVQNVALDLLDWSRNVLGDLEKRIKWARNALEVCRQGPMNGTTMGRMELLKFKLDRLEEQKKYLLEAESEGALARER